MDPFSYRDARVTIGERQLPVTSVTIEIRADARRATRALKALGARIEHLDPTSIKLRGLMSREHTVRKALGEMD